MYKHRQTPRTVFLVCFRFLFLFDVFLLLIDRVPDPQINQPLFSSLDWFSSML